MQIFVVVVFFPNDKINQCEYPSLCFYFIYHFNLQNGHSCVYIAEHNEKKNKTKHSNSAACDSLIMMITLIL